jgi:hypothetical protein
VLLSALFDGDFSRYFAQAGQGAPLWLFVHVPKTAGSSMEVEMEAIWKPCANIEIDYTDSSKPYHVAFDEAVQRFIARHQHEPYQFAAGHVVARHTEMIRQAVPELRAFSMLRNPVSRIVSDYRYQRSEMNLARAEFIKSTPDFETYIARKHVHNKTATALVPKPIVEAGDGAAAVQHVMENYAFIGLQEMYPICLRALTTLMGHPKTPEAKVRVNSEKSNAVEMNPELEARLKRLNAVDVALFQAFTEKWRGIRDDLRDYLNTHGRSKAA